MAIVTAFLAADLAAMIADMPHTARFGAEEFSCEATELSASEALVLCGNIDEKALRVVFSSTAFMVTSAFKAQGHLDVKYPNPAAFTTYEIVDIQLSRDRVAYEVVLKADNRA